MFQLARAAAGGTSGSRRLSGDDFSRRAFLNAATQLPSQAMSGLLDLGEMRRLLGIPLRDFSLDC
jgi:hypothetical protein